MKYWAEKTDVKGKIVIEVIPAGDQAQHDFIQTWVANYLFNFLTDPAWKYSLFPWEKIIQIYKKPPEKEVFAAYSESKLQGLIAITHIDGTEVSYVAAAPWNYYKCDSRIRGIGSILIHHAILRSKEMGSGGTIRLYSIPDAEHYYEKKLNMRRTGNISENGLVEFVLDTQAAQKLLETTVCETIREREAT